MYMPAPMMEEMKLPVEVADNFMLFNIQHTNIIWFLRFSTMANPSAVADFRHLPENWR
jgi:hypothetical protein